MEEEDKDYIESMISRMVITHLLEGIVIILLIIYVFIYC